MKILSVALLLAASVAFVALGCSDNPTEPVLPADQSTVVPPSLGKDISGGFSEEVGPFSNNPFEVVLDPGFTKNPDGKSIGRGLLLKTFFKAAFPGDFPGTDLLSGDGVLEMNFNGDLVAGELFTWGKLTVTPCAPEAGGGVWEITWSGKGTLTPQGWVTPLKQVGHGKGGALTGMQLTGDLVVTLWELPVGWTGTGNGFIRAH
jgi:hypothetical protein